MTVERIVIIGAGLAGASTATELREQGFSGGIELIGAEVHAPYIRPPLSKGYLAGDDERSSFDVHPRDWYAAHDVTWIPGVAATAIDRERRRVDLDDGGSTPYDLLLLATGATPRIIDVPGAHLGGVRMLRTVDDSEALRADLAGGGRRIAVIGGGWIGMEVAAAARTLGNEVVVILRGGFPLETQIGAALGSDFSRLHEENGVEFRTGARVRALLGDAEVSAVELDDGEKIAADLVVVAIGAEPVVGLAAAAGLTIGDGVLVDAQLRTDDARIWAAGDIANLAHPLLAAAGLPERVRSEHWANAEKTGRAAARSMLGRVEPYDAVPYFYTDQFDLGMEYTGFPHLAGEGELVIRGERDAREFIAFWVREGAVVAGMNVNVWDVAGEIDALVRGGLAGETVSLDRLADPDTPLDSI